MLDWFRRRRTAAEPSRLVTTIGEIQVASGTLLMGDPRYLFDPLRIQMLPPGPFPVVAEIIEYPEGGRRIARLEIRFRPGAKDTSRVLRELAIDSAMVVLIDERDYEDDWREVGPERIGRTSTPKHHERVAELIGRRFNLLWRHVDLFHSVFEEPISEELEARIVEYVRSFKEYSDSWYLYFQITTRDTVDRIHEAMRDRYWNEVVLDEETGANLLAVKTGFGDGSYPVVGHHAAGELIGIEVEFIGPAQDRLLEAFPLLRT